MVREIKKKYMAIDIKLKKGKLPAYKEIEYKIKRKNYN